MRPTDPLVLVVAESSAIEVGRRLQKNLAATGLAVELLVTGEGRESDLDAGLRAATHLVAVADEPTFRAAWLDYASGYLAGRREQGFVVGSGRNGLPPFASARFRIVEEADLAHEVEKAVRGWRLCCRYSRAKSSLIAAGLALTVESFADTVTKGDCFSVQSFLDLGFSPDTADARGVPVLCLAARAGRGAVVEILLKAGASVDAAAADRGSTPLSDAAAAGNDEVMRLLVGWGAEVDRPMRSGQTPLMIVVGRGLAPAAHLLLEAGADPDRTDKLGMSARGYAELFKQEKLTELFRTKGDRDEPK